MRMMLSDQNVRQLRLHAQKLARQPADPRISVVELVKELVGIQAQDMRAARLAIGVRSSGLLASEVEAARIQERSLVRTWGLRGTLHLLATDDLDWLLPLLGPVFVAREQRRRAELGLDEQTCTRGIQLLGRVLATQGPLTRDELIEHLARQGLQLVGQARPHVLMRTALQGVVCFGPEREGEPTYVLLNDWIKPERSSRSWSEAAAYAELSRRYLHAYGPATLHDQVAWSGLPMRQTRAAWQDMADQLLEVEVAGAPAWMLKEDAARLQEASPSTPIIRLLPSFDPYLLGYQQRDLIVSPPYARRINAGGGMLHPTLLADGWVVGTWKSRWQKTQMEVQVAPFEPLAPTVVAGMEAEISGLARFLQTPLALRIMPQS